MGTDRSNKTSTPSDPTGLPQKILFSVKLASILDQYPDSPLALVYLKEAESAGVDPRAVYDQAVRMLKGGTRRSLPTFEALTSPSSASSLKTVAPGRPVRAPEVGTRATKMRFSVNIFDELFGKRIELEVPTSDGHVVKRSVTRRWFEKMQADGKISRIEQPVIRVHVLGVGGYYVDTWVIGRDVSEETVAKFRHMPSDALYAMTYFAAGEPQTQVMVKALWDEAKRRVDAL